MSVLLTGGAGYIGSHTCIEILNAGMDVVVVDNYANSSPIAMKRVEEIVGHEVKHYAVDCCDEAALRKVFEENKIDSVVHFAGYKAVGESVRKPLMYYKNNLDSTFTLLSLMKEFGVTDFIFSSSATVYGLSEAVPYKEDLPTGCINPYGWTKFMNEQILRDYAFANPEMSVVLLRYFNPIGAHESGLIGDDPEGIPNNLMPYVCQVASGKLEKLHVFGNDYPTPDGTGVRDYLHVVDLAQGHVAAIKYAKDHKGTEAINLGTGIGYSVLDLVHAFEEANDLTLPYVIDPRRPGDGATSYADSTKAKELLGWTAKKTLVDMCRDAWNWQKKNPRGYEE
ncbi:MAG: UDP-glucose 4-epimerase GalE [Clostridiales bacterium]|nr:UDP-glucose 4-epimerase GalE [Clostridiales bacterium]MBP3940511.1 UDP-glucose 4-epimerase GalE [Christensenellaceae bacterium]MBR2223789.1 UDP-glucose 4-epimerase GalE [Christensenellaceae bacterium]MBR3842309.1 UDP-glucose 4-epimerase GalE [Christensenellaceae bacterium]